MCLLSDYWGRKDWKSFITNERNIITSIHSQLLIIDEIVHLSFKTGNNIGDLHYVWHGNTEDTDVALLEKNLAVLRNFSHHFQSIAPVLQCLLSLDEYLLELNLTGDNVFSSNLTEEKVDKHVKQLLDMEPKDPQTIADLADGNSSERKTKFDVFWSECSKFLAEDVGEAVDAIPLPTWQKLYLSGIS